MKAAINPGGQLYQVTILPYKKTKELIRRACSANVQDHRLYQVSAQWHAIIIKFLGKFKLSTLEENKLHDTT